MSAVYCVLGYADYESAHDLIGAYLSRESADAFVQRCRDYESTRPQWPQVTGDEEKDNAASAKHYRKWQRWEAKHPAGTVWANYSVYEVKVQP